MTRQVGLLERTQMLRPPMQVFGAVALLILLASPLPAAGESSTLTCQGLISADYVTPAGEMIGADGLPRGTVLRARITVGAGGISGGSGLVLPAVFFDLDCDSGSSAADCRDGGAVVSYVGDGTIATTCPGTWASNNPGGGTMPNEVVFMASEPLVIPAWTPNFCDLEFDVRIESKQTTGSSPFQIQQRVGFAGPALCDNGTFTRPAFNLAVGTQGLISCAEPTTAVSFSWIAPDESGYTARVHLDLGSGPVQGGTCLSADQVSFDLDCDPASPVKRCSDAGPVVTYLGDTTITTTCVGAVWGSNRPDGGDRPNTVVFVPSEAVEIPAYAPAFCSLEFDIHIGSGNSAVRVQQRQETRGQCDNGLSVSGETVWNVALAPNSGAASPGPHARKPGGAKR